MYCNLCLCHYLFIRSQFSVLTNLFGKNVLVVFCWEWIVVRAVVTMSKSWMEVEFLFPKLHATIWSKKRKRKIHFCYLRNRNTSNKILLLSFVFQHNSLIFLLYPFFCSHFGAKFLFDNEKSLSKLNEITVV